MATLWRRGPLPFVSLVEEVRAAHPWADTTIKTLLARLIHKGAIRSVREDGRQRYHALVSREQYIDAELSGLVDRLFEGEIARLEAWLAGKR